MRKLLITGAHSFIGNAVLERLKNDPEIQATAVSVRDGAWKNMNFSGYDSILHCAGIAHVSPDPSLEKQYHEINFRLTADLAAKAKEEGVKQFVFLSSMIVFGPAAPAGVRKVITKDTLPSPENAYGQSKLDAEKAIAALTDESFRAAILRPPMVYGKGCKGNYNTLVSLAKKLPVFPEFENYRSMIYVENLAELIRLIVKNNDCGTFHPQDASPRSVTEIVREICASHGKKMFFTRLLAPAVKLVGKKGLARRAFGDMVYDLSMSDYSENYRVFTFEEAIRKTEGGSPWRA